jgi:hypothetical protein
VQNLQIMMQILQILQGLIHQDSAYNIKHCGIGLLFREGFLFCDRFSIILQLSFSSGLQMPGYQFGPDAAPKTKKEGC